MKRADTVLPVTCALTHLPAADRQPKHSQLGQAPKTTAQYCGRGTPADTKQHPTLATKTPEHHQHHRQAAPGIEPRTSYPCPRCPPAVPRTPAAAAAGDRRARAVRSGSRRTTRSSSRTATTTRRRKQRTPQPQRPRAAPAAKKQRTPPPSLPPPLVGKLRTSSLSAPAASSLRTAGASPAAAAFQSASGGGGGPAGGVAEAGAGWGWLAGSASAFASSATSGFGCSFQSCRCGCEHIDGQLTCAGTKRISRRWWRRTGRRGPGGGYFCTHLPRVPYVGDLFTLAALFGPCFDHCVTSTRGEAEAILQWKHCANCRRSYDQGLCLLIENDEWGGKQKQEQSEPEQRD